jgi:hypothetical protein
MSLAGIVFLISDSAVSMTTRGRGLPALPIFIVEILLNAVLYLFYYRNTFRNPAVPEGKRNLWSIITFMTGPIG